MVRERAQNKMVYNQPAGHVEVGETLQAAAERETLEETGWQVQIQSLLGVIPTRKVLMESITYGTALSQLLNNSYIRSHRMRTLRVRSG